MKPSNLLLVMLLGVLAASFAGVGSLCAQEKAGNPMVLVKTSMGSFKIELFAKEAPVTVKNFLNYVDKKFYDGTIFHRVMPGFVIQGGGFDKKMVQKTTLAPIQNEAKNGLKNLRGTLSMARTNDINSATSQFFVNLKNNADPRPCQRRAVRLRRVRQGRAGHGRDREDRGSDDRHQGTASERSRKADHHRIDDAGRG